MSRIAFYLIVALICSLAANDCYGQMVTTSVPYQTSSNSFFENNSINWSLRGKNWFANSGGSPLPPFGGMAGGGTGKGLLTVELRRTGLKTMVLPGWGMNDMVSW